MCIRDRSPWPAHPLPGRWSSPLGSATATGGARGLRANWLAWAEPPPNAEPSAPCHGRGRARPSARAL
eukprot:4943835-Alexandrium_andersonii.AAC.1